MNVRNLVPHAIKPALKQLVYQYQLYSPLAGPVPPEWGIFTGNGDFVEVGNQVFKRLSEEGGLQPHHRVLDVGCGMGRVALPLTQYLNSGAGGSYDGFDIVKKGIDWCRQKYRRFPHFRFQHSDVVNRHYNSQGRYRASEYRFPHPDSTFDLVFLNSVFTHMLPADVKNYLAEVARVLKPGGVCCITYFLMTPDALDLVAAGMASQNLARFAPTHDAHWVTTPEDPEDATGYPKQFVEELYRANGLTLEKILYGNWCGRERFYEFQDVVFGRKNERSPSVRT